MAIMITDECINCGACEPECPNTAIYEGGVEWTWTRRKAIRWINQWNRDTRDHSRKITKVQSEIACSSKRALKVTIELLQVIAPAVLNMPLLRHTCVVIIVLSGHLSTYILTQLQNLASNISQQPDYRSRVMRRRKRSCWARLAGVQYWHPSRSFVQYSTSPLG